MTNGVVVLEGAGGSVANNALGMANDVIYDLLVDGGGYPDGEFCLVCAFATAPTEGAVIALYAAPQDVGGPFGSEDTETPETTRPTYPVGVFVVNNVTSQQVITLRAFDLPFKAQYYIHNNGTGQTISAGWYLSVSPFTKGPAA